MMGGGSSHGEEGRALGSPYYSPCTLKFRAGLSLGMKHASNIDTYDKNKNKEFDFSNNHERLETEVTCGSTLPYRHPKLSSSILHCPTMDGKDMTGSWLPWSGTL